ncbi:MAG TPA: alpha/beta hydrolase [Streptosporangiaceae bacterium]|nr:alpha/beta hydrolase [Streptosporangiaceae bacterium]
MGRRAMLRTGVLGGGAALAVGAAGGFSKAAATTTQPPLELFAQSDLNFETLFTLGSAGYGCAEVGEVVTTVNRINAAGASYQTYYDGFMAMARSVEALAGRELRAGHTASARSAYLRAASYYDACLFFVLGTTSHAIEAGVYAAMQRCWNLASQLFDPPFERVKIPYGRTWMPGYLLRPDTRPVRRPTVILNNGSDAQNVDLYAFGGAAALERGYNALIFEGPGQGSMLFERQIPLRVDWEHVVTPIVDYLSSRPDVDRKRIAITGWSLCGESVIRAAAFEHRLAAVVADPGVLDAWLVWPASVRSLFTPGATRQQVNAEWQGVIPHLDPVSRFTLMKRAELYARQFLLAGRSGQVFTNLWLLGQILMRLNVTKVAPLVTSPTLITQYELDSFATNQARPVYSLLRSPKAYHYFTSAHGAEYHDAPMAPQTRNQVVFDWLDDTL